jgi:hypothetical protein
MSLEDRDWYRAELARRERRSRGSKRRHALSAGATGGILMVIMAIELVAASSACGSGGWQTTPGACWRSGWSALADRVSGNMAASRGHPLTVVRVGR